MPRVRRSEIKNQLSFIGAMEGGHTEGIVELPIDNQDAHQGRKTYWNAVNIYYHHNQTT
jgi:hypothetical protein